MPGRVSAAVLSFAASCEGWTLDDEKSWKVARCDGVKMQNLLLQFSRSEIVQLSCAVMFCGCMNTNEEGILAAPLFDAI
jgi:hypothetical protein